MRLYFLAVLATVAAGAALAQGTGPAPALLGAPGRYAIASAGDGIVRLDTQTGTVSLCRRQDTQMSCEPALEANGEILSAIASLNERVARLAETVNGLSGDVGGLKTQTTGAQADLADIKSDLAGVKTDLAALKSDTAALKGLGGDVAALKSVPADLAAVRQRTEDLEKTALRAPTSLSPAEQKEMDQMLSVTDQMMRRLFGLVTEIKRSEQGGK